MVEGMLLALAAAVVYGFLGICFEVAGKRHYNIWSVILVKQTAGLLLGLAVWAFGSAPLASLRLGWLGFIGAFSYIATLAAYLKASRQRDIAANWTIVNLSVLIPILVSVFWFQDAFTARKAIGIACTLASIVAIGGGFEGSSAGGAGWLRAIAIAFFFNSWLVVLFRFVPAGSEVLFTVYFHGLSIPMALLYKLARDRQWQISQGLLGVSAASAVTHWGGVVLTMLALIEVGRVSAQAGVIVYPITNGLVIPIGVVLGALLLKQKIQRRSALGVACGMAALVFLSLP